MWKLFIREFGQDETKWRLVSVSASRDAIEWSKNQFIYDGYEAKIEKEA